MALDSLRHNARIYFHGHSVGGTNPSLEAMACQTFIIAHDNEFNRSVCNENALYFTSKEDVSSLISTYDCGYEMMILQMKQDSLRVIKENYSWKLIVDSYEDLFIKTCAGM